MVIVKLSSGLGNQLFMLAFLKYLEQENGNIDFFFDTSSFSNDLSFRQSEIKIVYPNYSTHHGNLLINLQRIKYLRGISKFLLARMSNLNIVDESDFIKSPFILNPAVNYYFIGFWQTDEFVKKLKNKSSLFSPKAPIPEIISKYLSLINTSEETASIHIRRGDYFSDLYIKRYGVCTKQYYEIATNTLLAKKSISHMFVFSDDMKWVTDNLTFPKHIKLTLVDNSNINSFWYIYLMSHCKNNIISNSTFSWWGAYLNFHEEKIVIAPNKWRFDSLDNPALSSWLKVNPS